MKIKNRLYLSAGISIILVLILFSLVLVMSGRVAEGNQKHKLLDNVLGGVAELDIVTYDYLLHRETRMEQQWHLKYYSLAKVLDKAGEEERIPIHTDYAALGDLFSQVTANNERTQKLILEGASQGKIDIAIELEERLVAKLLKTSHSIFTDVSILAEGAQVEVIEAQRLTANLTLILMIILAAAVTTSLLLIARSISKPLNELTKGTEIIGKGDLDHKVEIKTKDELGELAAAFNQMTEKRQLAEEALRQSETKYHDLYTSAPVAYFSIGIDGLIKEVNKAAEDLTGYRFEELQRMKAIDLYAEGSEENAKVLFEKFKRGISWENEEMIYERKDGQKIHGLLSVSPIKNENGLILESRSVVVDITERKRAEDELEKHRNHLEEMIGIRTAELGKRISEVSANAFRRWSNSTVLWLI
jgi:PAS domain S-box-containing protein